MIRVAVAVVLLTGAAGAVGAVRRLGQARDLLVAVLRAVLQLTVVGLVIAAVFRSSALAPAYLGVVLAAASWTSGRRIGSHPAGYAVAAASIASGTFVAAGIVFATGALGVDARTAVPFLAQLAGGSMTATSLAGQRLHDDITTSWHEIEGWLALGASPARAARDLARRAATRALVPAIDQTRNVGLVVLPGAYVGLLLAGASPLEAGRIQLLVLVGLLAAETVAVVLATCLLAPLLAARRPPAA